MMTNLQEIPFISINEHENVSLVHDNGLLINNSVSQERHEIWQSELIAYN